MDIKRLFFGMEAIAPWPESLPSGRALIESDRHLTLAFLGDADVSQILPLLSTMPKPSFKTGLAGYFDRPIFLPHRSPRVAAWHIRWLEGEEAFNHFQKEIVQWLKEKGFSPKEKEGEFLPHVTLARSPFSIQDWKRSFEKLPVFTKDLHLCESLGYSRYEVRWSYPIAAPFEEIEHTADIAFLIRGSDFSQLYLHAQLALSFHFPPLLDYFAFEATTSLEEVIESLNRLIAKVDQMQGSPFKAISYHGAAKETRPWIEWEMIVDV